MMYKRGILIFSVWAGIASALSAQNYCSRATTSFAGGNYDEAIRYYNICMKDTGRDLSGEIKRAERCKTLIAQSEAFWEINDYEHANQKYRELLALNPGDPVAKSRLTASAEAEVAVAPAPPREGRWTRVSISGFQMNLDRTVDFHFSNGQAAYFVLSSHGDGYPVRKYDIASRSWTSPAILGRDFLNSRTMFYMAPVINGVAYMAGLEENHERRRIELKIMRYDMRSDAALPTMSIPLNVSLGEFPHISGGCAVGSKLVFMLRYGQILTFDVGNGEARIYKSDHDIVSSQCAMFNFGGKVIIISHYGLTAEFDPVTGKYASKNGTSALAATTGFGYPVYGAPLGGRGYVLSLNNRTPQFREYNPATDAWRNLTLPVTGDVRDVYGFPLNASRMFIGIKRLDASYNPVWQYYIYEINN
jgi:hypothetical protein